MTSEEPALAGIGLGPEATRLYRALFADLGLPDDATAAAGLLSPACWSQARAELLSAGLAESDGGRLLPIDPRIGVRRLVHAQQAELDAAMASIDSLTQEYLDGRGRGGDDPMTELVTGRQQMLATMRALIDAAEHDVAVLDTPPYSAANAVESTEESSLTRGVRTRVVYATEALELPPLYAHIQRMAEAGEESRVLPAVPLKLLLVDGDKALLPLATGEDAPQRAVLVHPSPVAEAINALFETLWNTGLPLFERGQTVGPALDPEEQELVRLLAVGIKDEAIARRLGISIRTLSRRVNALLTRLGAANRFQAGLQAARHGWLDASTEPTASGDPPGQGASR